MSLADIRRQIAKLTEVVKEREASRVTVELGPIEVVRRAAFILRRASAKTATSSDVAAAARIREILGPDLSSMLFDALELSFTNPQQSVSGH